jgi:exosortase
MTETRTTTHQLPGKTTAKPGFQFRRWHLMAVLIIIAYFPVLYDLVIDWSTDDNYSHGFLVPLVAGYFLWRRREEWKKVVFSYMPVGWIMVLFALGLFVVGTAGAEYFTARCSLVFLLFGLAWTFGGKAVLRLAWFPIAYLLFMIPIPYVIYYSATFPMQLLASKVAGKALAIIGVPHLQQGNIIHLPAYSLEVAEACSGLRSLVSLLALGAAYARFTQPNLSWQIVLFLLTIPIALAANVFRVWATAVGAYAISPKVAEDFLHEFSGIVVFVISFILLFAIGGVFYWWQNRKHRSSSPAP